MLHHSSDDLMVQQQMAIIDDLEYTSSAKSAENKSEITNCFENTASNKRASSTTNQEIIKESPIETINNIDNDGDDVIELDSSPEKTIAQDKKTLSTPTKETLDESNNLSNNSTLKENTIKMQPLEKVRETITKSNETSDIKASSDIKEQNEKNENDIENDQNKENLENNEIQNQIQNGSKDNDNDNDNDEDDDEDDDDEIIENKENQINEDNINEKSITNEIQLNEKVTSEEVTIDNEKNLELMDVSEIPTITENNIDDKSSIKNDIKIEKIESISSNQLVTNDIKINDILQKSPEPPTSLTVTASNTSSTVPINRKRLRSRSNNDDEQNISNNIQLTSTPLANHKIDHKGLNSIEQNSTITAATATVIPNNINANNYTNNLDDDEEQLHPTKKLRAELETNFTKHNRILHEYIERTTNDTPDDIDKHISQLAIEIQTLNDMIKAKELEWNNMLHLKKVKEEICFRLTRKKQVMELMATKLGEISNHVPNAISSIDQNLLGEKLSIAAQLKIPNITNHLTNSSISTSLAQNHPGSSSSALAAMAAATTNLLNYSAAAASNKSNSNLLNSNNNEYLLNSNSSSATSTSAAQNILQLRANMKSSDLAKEKTSAQKIHRLLVSRNILPKPSSTSSSATVTSGSPQHQLQQQQQLLATSLIQNIGGNNGGGGASASQLATLSGLFGSATAPVVISTATSGGGGAVQMPLPLSNVATGSLMSAHTPPGATQTSSSNATASTGINHQPTILNNYLTAAAASVQQQLGELFNGHHNPNSQNGQNLMIGRQGVFKDVKSIIADYRQRHPEQVPRRGRRMKSTNSNDVSVGGSGQNRINSELNNLLNRLEANSRPSSNDSSSHHSLTNVNAAAAAAVAANLSGAAGATGNISFKDVLVQFAKMSGQPIDRLSAAAAVAAITTPPSSQNNNNNNNSINNNSNSNKNNNTTNNITNTTATSITSISQNNNNSNSNPSTFPEVTLHPVSTTNQNQSADQSGSLLHGILTKYSRGGSSSAHSPNASQNSILNAVVAAGQQQQQQQQQQQTSCAPTSTTTNYNSTFSPTLARLLTAPERITNNLSGSQNSTIGSHQTSTITAAQAAAAAAAASNSTGLNLTKVVAHNNEITITPVINSGNSGQQTALQHSLLQKQIKDALNISKNIGSGTPSDRIKSEYFMNIDDEADDSVDRLVIDEGGGDAGNGDDLHRIAPNAIGQEFHENEVPWCQGCKNQEAQFVCAGCGSQWYCSRECQVQAWDEHSETCTG